jgi:hypothetical protein
MKNALIALCTAAVASLQASPSSTQNFPDLNFSVEIPSDWVPVSVNLPMCKGAYRNASGEKSVMIMAFPTPLGERDYAVIDFLKGVSDGKTKAGWSVFPRQTSVVSGLPFLSQTYSLNNASSMAYAVSAGNMTYGLMLQKNTGAAFDDEELGSIIQSFRLLNPVPVNENAERRVTAGTTIGWIVGKVLVLCVFPVLFALFWLFFNRKKPEDS